MSAFSGCRSSRISSFLAVLSIACSTAIAQGQQPLPKVEIDWKTTVRVSRSTPTLQVVTNPMLNPGAPMHDGSFAALKALGADYVRYVPWMPYPKIAVAELDPPAKEKTSWDFTYTDPVTKDFLDATAGHSTVMNFSTIPQWMYKTKKPVAYPADPNQVTWNYEQGTELVDPSGKQVADYFARLVSWYTKGGFTDENGKQHTSGYHYNFPYWEVLNEVEGEHNMTPEGYTRLYDEVVEAIHKVSPETKFMGLALAAPRELPQYFEYFLNPRNHKPGTPLDYVSFHFYAVPAMAEGPDNWQYTFFNQADSFLFATRYILAIRDRLSPATKVDTDELGSILPRDFVENSTMKRQPENFSPRYWNAAAALYAYLFTGLSRQGVDVIGESQLVGYPTQYPTVTMMDYHNNKPNARYWVLKLIKDNFHPGDTLVSTWREPDGITAQGFVTPAGRKVLLVNRTNSEKVFSLGKDFTSATAQTVDEATGDEAPRTDAVNEGSIKLAPFAVSVVTQR